MILNPLDFEEFLTAIGDHVTFNFLRESFIKKKPLGNLLKTCNERLRTYMIVGGMPQAVLSYIETKNFDSVERTKRLILKLYREDIVKYAENYVAEATAIFNAIPSNLSHHDKKIKFSALDEGDRFSSYKDAINWINDSMVGRICYGLDEPTIFDGFSLQVNKIKCYMTDTGLLLTLATGEKYLESELYKSFILGKLAVNKGMMVENLVSQMFLSNSHNLRFYEVYLEENGRKKKYEVDFLIKQNGKITPIEVKSGKANYHPSLDLFIKRYKERINKPIILKKGDLQETTDYLYLTLAMAMFL